MRKTLFLILAAALFLGFGSLEAGNPAKTQWVLTAAKATGVGGAQFVTSLRIVNPNPQAASVDLTYLPQSPLDGSVDNSAATPVNVTVPGNQTLAIEDVVGTRFGSSAAAGGIKVVSSVPVTVLSRTYVANARSETGVPGIYGYSIPGEIAEEGIAAGETAYLPYIAASPSDEMGFRTNFIMLNTANAVSVVNARLVKGDGTLIGQRDYTLNKLAATQHGRLPTSSPFSYTALDENLTLIVTVRSGGPVLVGATVIDNGIRSQAFVPASKVALPNNSSYGMIFVNGTDLYGFSGRLDIRNSEPEYMSAGVVVNCPPGNPLVFFFQAFGKDSSKNTDFTKNADGTFSVSGSDTSANWTGSIEYQVDGTVTGSFTYSRKAGAASCPGQSKTLQFAAAPSAPYTP